MDVLFEGVCADTLKLWTATLKIDYNYKGNLGFETLNSEETKTTNNKWIYITSKHWIFLFIFVYFYYFEFWPFWSWKFEVRADLAAAFLAKMNTKMQSKRQWTLKCIENENDDWNGFKSEIKTQMLQSEHEH